MRRNAAFRARVKKRDYTLVIRTADRRYGRYFTFTGGQILSKRGPHPNPTVEMVWTDVPTAFRALASGEKKAVVQALGTSKLKIEGNLDYFFWFGDTMDVLG
jgi:hypothetical protein